MTGRDRMVIMAIAVLAILAGGWLLAVSPERKEAAREFPPVPWQKGRAAE